MSKMIKKSKNNKVIGNKKMKKNNRKSHRFQRIKRSSPVSKKLSNEFFLLQGLKDCLFL